MPSFFFTCWQQLTETAGRPKFLRPVSPPPLRRGCFFYLWDPLQKPELTLLAKAEVAAGAITQAFHHLNTASPMVASSAKAFQCCEGVLPPAGVPELYYAYHGIAHLPPWIRNLHKDCCTKAGLGPPLTVVAPQQAASQQPLPTTILCKSTAKNKWLD